MSSLLHPELRSPLPYHRSASNETVEFRIHPGRVAVTLVAISVLFTALGLSGQALQDHLMPLGAILRVLFDVGREGNVSTFYSALLLATSAVLLYVIHVSSTHSKDKYRFHWLGLAIVFAYLAVDEAARLHELPSDMLREYLMSLDTEVADVFVPTPWVLPAGLALLVVGVLYLPFLFALPRRSAWLFVAAGSIYISGAVLFEMWAWHYLFQMAGLNYVEHLSDAKYVLLTAVEEFLEMAGVILFIYALLSHIAREMTVARISFARELHT